MIIFLSKIFTISKLLVNLCQKFALFTNYHWNLIQNIIHIYFTKMNPKCKGKTPFTNLTFPLGIISLLISTNFSTTVSSLIPLLMSFHPGIARNSKQTPKTEVFTPADDATYPLKPHGDGILRILFSTSSGWLLCCYTKWKNSQTGTCMGTKTKTLTNDKSRDLFCVLLETFLMFWRRFCLAGDFSGVIQDFFEYYWRLFWWFGDFSCVLCFEDFSVLLNLI